MTEHGNSVSQGPRVDGYVKRQRMDGEDTVSLEVRGGPTDSLEDVLGAWDERVEDMLDELEADDEP